MRQIGCAYSTRFMVLGAQPYSYLLSISGNAHKFRNDNIGIPLPVTIPILSLMKQGGCADSTRLIVFGGT